MVRKPEPKLQTAPCPSCGTEIFIGAAQCPICSTLVTRDRTGPSLKRGRRKVPWDDAAFARISGRDRRSPPPFRRKPKSEDAGTPPPEAEPAPPRSSAVEPQAEGPAIEMPAPGPTSAATPEPEAPASAAIEMPPRPEPDEPAPEPDEPAPPEPALSEAEPQPEAPHLSDTVAAASLLPEPPPAEFVEPEPLNLQGMEEVPAAEPPQPEPPLPPPARAARSRASKPKSPAKPRAAKPRKARSGKAAPAVSAEAPVRDDEAAAPASQAKEPDRPVQPPFAAAAALSLSPLPTAAPQPRAEAAPEPPPIQSEPGPDVPDTEPAAPETAPEPRYVEAEPRSLPAGDNRLADFRPAFVAVRPEGFERRPTRRVGRSVVPALAVLLVLIAGAWAWQSGIIPDLASITEPTQTTLAGPPPAAPPKAPPAAAPPAETAAPPPPQETARLEPPAAANPAPPAQEPPSPEPMPPVSTAPPPEPPAAKPQKAAEDTSKAEKPRKRASTRQQRKDEIATADDTWRRERQAKMDQAFAYGDVVARVQGSLSHLGYYPGPVDGMLTPSTSAAIRAFQRDIGVRATGDIEYGLLAQLQQARNTSPVSRPRSPYAPHSPYRLNP